jgi:hypothetical protein
MLDDGCAVTPTMLHITLVEWALWGLSFFLSGFIAGLWVLRGAREGRRYRSSSRDPNITLESVDVVRALAKKCKGRS